MAIARTKGTAKKSFHTTMAFATTATKNAAMIGRNDADPGLRWFIAPNARLRAVKPSGAGRPHPAGIGAIP
jgi:hypothetical protein